MAEVDDGVDDRRDSPAPLAAGAVAPGDSVGYPQQRSNMPIGYLVTVTLVALCTLFALAPVRRPWPLNVLSYYGGLLLNELPFVAFYWLLASTLLAFGQVMSTRRAGGWWSG